MLIFNPPSASADVSAVKSEAWENLKAKNFAFDHSTRHVNQHEKYIWPKYRFLSPPPQKKEGFNECYCLVWIYARKSTIEQDTWFRAVPADSSRLVPTPGQKMLVSMLIYAKGHDKPVWKWE